MLTSYNNNKNNLEFLKYKKYNIKDVNKVHNELD